MVDLCLRTVTFRGADLSPGATSADVLSSLLCSLGEDIALKVESIQFCRNKYFKVTFTDGLLKGRFEKEGVIIDGVHCPAVDGPPPPVI